MTSVVSLETSNKENEVTGDAGDLAVYLCLGLRAIADSRLAQRIKPITSAFILHPSSLILASYGNASTLKKNLNDPVACTPSTSCRLTLAPGANGDPTVIVPVVTLLFIPPPIG